MLSWKTLNSLEITKFCKGRILSARVYADVKGGKCSCGGVFTKRVSCSEKNALPVPVCSSCGEDPAFYVIDADAKDENGNKLKLRIRNTKDNERLDSRENVSYIIKIIQREIMDGTFNVRLYDSAKSKEAFKFENYAIEYLKHHERRLERGEITPKGLLDKKSLVNRQLVPYFGKLEIYRITPSHIRAFAKSYTDKFRTRDLALGELKALLNQAERDDLIKHAPKFDPIPKANKRKEIISLELARKTVETITKEIYRDMYTLLLSYPIRPSELRALSWKNIDLIKGTFTINQHFSDNTLIDGRKSVKLDKKEGSITFPISETARFIFLKYRNAKIVSLDSFVFLSHTGKQVSGDALWEAWKVARDKLKHNFAPYECRHVAASELYKKLDGDLIRMKEVGGWTNTGTLELYVKDRSDNSDLFN